MKGPRYLLFSAVLGIATISTHAAGAEAAVAETQSPVVLAQDLLSVRDAGKVRAAIWTRRPDYYTLQLVMPRGLLRASVPFTIRNLRDVDPRNVDYAGERGSYFTGATIANLRGLDPDFGDRTLVLTDGRRSAASSVASPAPALEEVDVTGVRIRPPVVRQGTTTPRDPPKIQVWLLGADGSAIRPSWQSPVPTPQTGCGPACLADEVLYRFASADGARAVAAAISIDGQYYIEKLQPLEPKPAAQ